METEQKKLLQRVAIVAVGFVISIVLLYVGFKPKAPAPPEAAEKLPVLAPHKSSVLAVFRSGRWLLDANTNGQWDGNAGGDWRFSLGKSGTFR